MKSDESLQQQIKMLSRRLQAVYLIAGFIFFAQFILFIGIRIEASAETIDAADKVLKARGLIIVDDKGQERVLIGSPVPDTRDGKRINPLTGITINDPAGYERFGAGVMDNGNMILGLDAPPGTGDDRNRERIHLVADSKGGAVLRFLNRKTSVPGWLRLGDDDKLYLEFLDVQPNKNKVETRRIGLGGEQKLEESLK